MVINCFLFRWKTQQDEKEVDTRFKQRVGDIAFWKSELEGKLADLKREIEAVECKHIRVAAGLGATSEPLGIAEKCLANRGQRVGVDRCDDNVNKHLQVLLCKFISISEFSEIKTIKVLIK